MEWITLKAELRDKKGTRQVRRLRKDGFIPAVLYGRGTTEQLLMLSKKEIHSVMEKGVRLINLTLPQKTERAQIKEVQFDALGEMLLHIDFVRIAMDETITVDVEIKLKGQPKGTIAEEGIMEQNLHHISVKCLPADIPAKIELDVSELRVGDMIRVKDVSCSPGVTFETDPEVVVAGVHMKKEEEVVVAEVEPSAAEPEVITEKKEVALEEKAEEKEGKKPPKEEKKEK